MLNFTLLDTDDVIEPRARATKQENKHHHGEQAFREREQRFVEDLIMRNKTVIATGGGLPPNEANLASLKSHSLVVCLWSSAEKIWQRVKGQTHRPLLNNPDPLAKINELLKIRGPYYRQADILINTEFRSLREVTHQVIHQFRSAQNGAAPPDIQY
jgi:shikimate kinase